MNPLAWLRVRKHLAIIVGLLTLFAHLVVYGCIWVGLELDGGISRHELAEILIPLTLRANGGVHYHTILHTPCLRLNLTTQKGMN